MHKSGQEVTRELASGLALRKLMSLFSGCSCFCLATGEQRVGLCGQLASESRVKLTMFHVTDSTVALLTICCHFWFRQRQAQRHEFPSAVAGTASSMEEAARLVKILGAAAKACRRQADVNKTSRLLGQMCDK